MPLGRDIRVMHFIIPVASDALKELIAIPEMQSINSKNIFHQPH
jgi:hypothetical protein